MIELESFCGKGVDLFHDDGHGEKGIVG
jgi:hypothetical protein